MSIILTRQAYANHSRVRLRHAPHRIVGPHWTVLGSDVLFAALNLANVEPSELLAGISRSGDRAELGRRSPLFHKLIAELPSCTFIVIKGGVVMVRCDGRFIYSEENRSAKLVVFGINLPETTITASKGRRLSEVVDASIFPALASIDPIVKGLRNELDVRSGTDHRVVVDLALKWRSFAPS